MRGHYTFLIQYFREKGKNLATKEDVRDITDRIESIKSHHASQLHISQVRYEKEFEILSDLSEKLVDLRDSALSLRPAMDYLNLNETEDERKQKRLARLQECMRALYLAAEKRRPFYPEEVYKLLNEFSQATWSEAVGYRLGRMSVDPKYWDQAQENAGAISSLANKALDAIRERIRTWEGFDVGRLDTDA